MAQCLVELLQLAVHKDKHNIIFMVFLEIPGDHPVGRASGYSLVSPSASIRYIFCSMSYLLSDVSAASLAVTRSGRVADRRSLHLHALQLFFQVLFDIFYKNVLDPVMSGVNDSQPLCHASMPV